jgi:hypothetical protein
MFSKGSAASGTEAMQLHFAPIDAKALDRGTPIDVNIEVVEIDVPDLAAPTTHEMMMIVGIDFKLHRSARPFEGTHQAGSDQFLHVAINGGVGDRREVLAHAPHQVVRGGDGRSFR